MKDFKVTAAVPCYNGEEFIDSCIDSLFNQTVKPDQIILVNDGSEDSSEEKIKKHENVELINHVKNLGLAEARNTAIKNSIGDIIVFIDSDARAHPDFIEMLLECYSEEDIVGVGGEAFEGNLVSVYDMWRSYHAYQGQKEKVVKKVDIIAGVASSYRRDIFEKVGLFDPEFRTNGEDMEFGLRVKKEDLSIYYTPFAKVDHLRTDNFKSLSKMIFNWYYYGYIGRKKVLGNAALWYLYVITKHGFRNLFQDIFKYRSFRLSLLSLWMVFVEYASVLKNLLISR